MDKVLKLQLANKNFENRKILGIEEESVDENKLNPNKITLLLFSKPEICRARLLTHNA